MGINEFAGYLSLAVVAFLTGRVASECSLRPYPFYIGIILSMLGFFGSWRLIKDTKHHVARETTTSNVTKLDKIFWETTWKNKNLGSVTQAGLINNLNDGMVWGLFPIGQNGIITAIYPAIWGIGQLFTGRMADYFCKKDLLFGGMLLQGFALVALLFASTMAHFIFLSFILGCGTAMVYPSFLATVAANTHPVDRANSLGVFRLWRDLGYAIGAILTGIIADTLGINASILIIGLLTIFSAGIIFYRMKCTDVNDVKLKDWITNKVMWTNKYNVRENKTKLE